MQVLVIGYGKIGKIKASLWKTLGAKVYVYDTSTKAQAVAITNGFEQFTNQLQGSDTIVDISTPAGYHFAAFEWCLSAFSDTPQTILIEKPLASTPAELKAFRQAIAAYPDPSLAERVYINESYYVSKGLNKLAAELAEPIVSIEIELSKNRLADIENGRFFDKDLAVLGIEMPHILAILQMLGFSLERHERQQPQLYIADEKFENQGMELQYKHKETAILLRSYLGDFTHAGDSVVSGNTITRKIIVQTSSQVYELEFDPAPQLPRYHSRLTCTGTKNYTETIADDHMRTHMKQFLTAATPPNSAITLDNAISLTELLLELRAHSQIHYVSTSESRSNQHDREQLLNLNSLTKEL